MTTIIASAGKLAGDRRKMVNYRQVSGVVGVRLLLSPMPLFSLIQIKKVSTTYNEVE